jgi:hypothetical protein
LKSFQLVVVLQDRDRIVFVVLNLVMDELLARANTPGMVFCSAAEHLAPLGLPILIMQVQEESRNNSNQ